MIDTRLPTTLPLLALLASAGVLASSLADLDLSLRESDIEPSVTIREHENRVVEEFRVNNNLYMIRITPSVGAPYYLIDPDGSGDMAWSRGPARVEQRVPQWALFSW